MATPPFFRPPANLREFHKESSYQGWSDWINNATELAIDRYYAPIYAKEPRHHLQYINPSKFPSTKPFIEDSRTFCSRDAIPKTLNLPLPFFSVLNSRFIAALTINYLEPWVSFPNGVSGGREPTPEQYALVDAPALNGAQDNPFRR